jgi:hypothetical protein
MKEIHLAFDFFHKYFKAEEIECRKAYVMDTAIVL